ncbi:hypothetical protein [Kitasatospora sp. NPDC088548]|uniref:hypothetical protein n=1 Tax=Kitasatospora sp. NPDC088548 TaxID=3364075 RepID=UPI00381637B7
MDPKPERTDESAEPAGAAGPGGRGSASSGRRGRTALDERAAAQLWEAMRNDRMARYFQEHRTGDTLGRTSTDPAGRGARFGN